MLSELYRYAKNHPNCTYAEAYRAVFQEEANNNNDIVRNYINNYSKVLHFEKNGQLTITDINPNTIFDFMDRNDKKSFFESFSQTNIVTTNQVLITEHNKLTGFILSTVKHFDSLDRLNAIVPYANSSSPIKVSKTDSFSLTGMFLESTIEDVRNRNTNHTRWFEDQFRLGDREVFLSTQWNSQGDYQLTLDDFIQMIKTCYGNDYVYKTGPNGEYQLYHIVASNLKELKKHPLQQIFYGAPGTGKSNTIKCEVDEKGLPRVRTTFHPDSDYSTFVGAYKPTSVEVPVMTMIGTKAVSVENPDGTLRTEKKIVYEFVPQAFLKAYTGAWKNQDEPFFLIIEEINRGNCAQIFGDLFQLLDRNDETGLSDYPISPNEDIQKFLLSDKKYGFAALTDKQKASIPETVLTGELMILPSNLHIWATMNTSDQSLFPIDSAFKRRWDWQYIPISDSKKGWRIEANGKHYDWWQFLQKINDQIGSTTNSEDKKLGYYFCKAKNGIIDAETFVGKVMFYVWNDVYKDFAEEAGDLFKDEDGGILSFSRFYTVDEDGKTKIVEKKIERLLQNLGIEPFSDTKSKNISEEEQPEE